MNLPAEFQSFSEELRGLPGKYAPPAGRLLLLSDLAGTPIATAALRPLHPTACEIKRLWVQPTHRHQGIAEALALYHKLGFEPTIPYTPSQS